MNTSSQFKKWTLSVYAYAVHLKCGRVECFYLMVFLWRDPFLARNQTQLLFETKHVHSVSIEHASRKFRVVCHIFFEYAGVDPLCMLIRF
jgi:hypothetical protein